MFDLEWLGRLAKDWLGRGRRLPLLLHGNSKIAVSAVTKF